MRAKTIEPSAIHNYWVMRDENGMVTHRIERSTYGDKLLMRNVHTGHTEIEADIF